MHGLGDVILCTKSFIDDEPFAVLLGDDLVYNEQKPAMQQLIQVYQTLGSNIAVCQSRQKTQIVSRNILQGVAVQKEQGDSAVGKLAVLGRHVLTPDIFEILHRVQPQEDGEIKLADALKLMDGRQSVYACEIAGKRYDIGNQLDYLKATVEYALQRDDLKTDFLLYLTSLK